jgi:hypothetical protein
MMRLMVVRIRLLIAPLVAVAVTACGTSAEDEALRADQPPMNEASAAATSTAVSTRTGRQTVEAFFAALRRGDADGAERYVAEGAIAREALDDLARLGEAVSAEVSEDGRVLLRSDEPMQYWPQCPFRMVLTSDGQQIAGQMSCEGPLPPSPA